MRKWTLGVSAAVSVVVLLGGLFGCSERGGASGKESSVSAEQTESVAVDGGVFGGLQMERLEGGAFDFRALDGKVVLVVNVASRCGMTPQYEALQSLYAARAGDGLVVLGVPSNDFGGQEPGSAEEIQAFCSERYGVTFPMTEKVRVKGDGRAELYERLALLPGSMGGEPTWNFTKYLVDGRGRVVAKFGPRTGPESEEVLEAIDAALSARQRG